MFKELMKSTTFKYAAAAGIGLCLFGGGYATGYFTGPQAHKTERHEQQMMNRPDFENGQMPEDFDMDKDFGMDEDFEMGPGGRGEMGNPMERMLEELSDEDKKKLLDALGMSEEELKSADMRAIDEKLDALDEKLDALDDETFEELADLMQGMKPGGKGDMGGFPGGMEPGMNDENAGGEFKINGDANAENNTQNNKPSGNRKENQKAGNSDTDSGATSDI